MRKVYVQVFADFDTDGNITPRSIIWEDGTEYPIDRILDRKHMASTKVGGLGLRYECRIQNKLSYLFYEEPNKWFVEAKI